MAADMENSEILKGLSKFDGKGPEQSRQELSAWITHRGRGHPGLLKPPEETKVQRPKRGTRRHSKNGKFETILPSTSTRTDTMHQQRRVANTFHRECVDGEPPREPRTHELMERSVRRFLCISRTLRRVSRPSTMT